MTFLLVVHALLARRAAIYQIHFGGTHFYVTRLMPIFFPLKEVHDIKVWGLCRPPEKSMSPSFQNAPCNSAAIPLIKLSPGNDASLPSTVIWCSVTRRGRICVRKSPSVPLEYIQLSRLRWTGCNMALHPSFWCQEDLSLGQYLDTVRWAGADLSGQHVQFKC